MSETGSPEEKLFTHFGTIQPMFRSWLWIHDCLKFGYCALYSSVRRKLMTGRPGW